MEEQVSEERRKFLKSSGASLAAVNLLPDSAFAVGDAVPNTYNKPPVDLGVVYIPFMGDKWNCSGGKPAVGHYDDLGAVNQHITQMVNHGISKLMFNFGESRKDFDRVRKYLNAEKSSEIAVETMWVIKKIFTRDLNIDDFLEFLRENLLSHSTHNTIDGRPVVQLWTAEYLAWDDETTAKIKDRWGGFPEFATYLKEELTVDGTKPYLVSEITDVPNQGLQGDSAVLHSQFDAMTTWFPNPQNDDKTEWDWLVKRAEGDFKVLRDFVDENDMDLIPTAFSGFDARFNDCWDVSRYTPRAPSHLGQMLRLADKYKTIGRINVATWNDWVEGHHIEPGRFAGTEYGTSYLEEIPAFLKEKQKEDEEQTTQTKARTTTTATETSVTTSTDPTSTQTATQSTRFSTKQSSSQEETSPPRSNKESGTTPGFGPLASVLGVGGAIAYHLRKGQNSNQ